MRSAPSFAIVLIASTFSCKPKEEPRPDAPKPSLIACDSGSIDPQTDLANCGFCDNKCAAEHGKTSCTGGKCTPVCDPGWETCGMPNEGCNRNVKRDPRACGACNKTCKGAPCVDGACTSAPAVLAKDAWGYGINTTDGTYLYLGQPNDTSTWTRVKIKDGTVESKDDKQQFAPAAFDGKFLYGCKGAHKEPRPPCELKKREGDGPETMVVSIQRVLYGKAIAVKDGTLYWARAIPNSMKEGRGPFADIVAMDLATKTEAVIAANEQAPLKIVVDDAAIYWVSSGIGGEGTGVRKLAKKGGGAIGLAILPVASSLDRRGEFVLATSVDGLFRVPAGGGAADLVLQGAPASVKAQFPSKGSDGIAVVGDEVYWTTAGKDVMFSTVLHATL